MAVKYFIDPFGVAGDRAAVPDASQPSGSVSYTNGFGADYSLKLVTYPQGKAVPRNQFNQLLFDVTSVLQQYQQHGVPDFITTLDNGGSPFPYDKWAYVLYNPGGGAQVYQSLVNSNTALPTDATKWTVIDDSGGATISGVQSAQYIYAVAGGTANAITVSLTPAIASTRGFAIVKAIASNTGAVTINFGYGAIPLLKHAIPGGGTGLSGGEIVANTDYLIFYESGSALLINPSQINSDAVTPTQLRDQTYVTFSDIGIVNNLTVNPSPNYSTSSTFLQILVKVLHNNTGPTNLTINGSATQVFKKPPTGSGALVPLTGGELLAGTIAVFEKNGGQWELQNPAATTLMFSQIRLSGTQTIAGGATDAVNFDTIDLDSYITATPPTVVIPADAPANALYQITANLGGIQAGGTLNNFAYLTVNGTPVRTFDTDNNQVGVFGGSLMAALNPGDTVGVSIFNNSAFNLVLQNASGIIGTNLLQVMLLGAHA